MSAAERAAALRSLREFQPIEGFRPLLTFGTGEDCDVVRNSAAALTLIATFLRTEAGEEFNRDILTHAIEGIAEMLFLREFAERAKPISKEASQ